MYRMLQGAVVWGCAFAALAAGPSAVRKTVEASMQVTGEVVVAPGGSVLSYTLDRADALAPEAKMLLEKYVPAWQLEVTRDDGRPLQSPIAVRMNVQLVARATGVDDQLGIVIEDTAFWDPKAPDFIKGKDLPPPQYPGSAARSGVSGVVYVVLRLEPDGTVAQVHAERVDMTVIASEKQLQQYRAMLAKAALDKARAWTFHVSPKQLETPGPISVRVPVEFAISMSRKPDEKSEYGKWRAYVPGPYAPIPWRKRTADSGIGAMAPGQVFPLDAPIKLRGAPTGS